MPGFGQPCRLSILDSGDARSGTAASPESKPGEAAFHAASPESNTYAFLFALEPRQAIRLFGRCFPRPCQRRACRGLPGARTGLFGRGGTDRSSADRQESPRMVRSPSAAWADYWILVTPSVERDRAPKASPESNSRCHRAAVRQVIGPSCRAGRRWYGRCRGGTCRPFQGFFAGPAVRAGFRSVTSGRKKISRTRFLARAPARVLESYY